ncbi:MAG: MaoC family dehydratase [Candidatus Nanopelagicales bacterium]|nr:MaoC family dehydratase [Candidatus Nanopelagicales bacterium]MCF8538640.1 MaoC family dehydratase [Candidatus Nanopelagicales bacterium]MCF8558272.1 MaoC family dehydratase [Candidatus Nanopelagicales bacterium]
MVSTESRAHLKVGYELPAKTFTVQRSDLVRYAGASGDFNVIHWNERIATDVGLPNVIAHGMLTMALAGQVVTDWLGDPGALLEYGVRFTRPVVVPDDGVGATIEVTAKVTRIDEAGTAQVTVTATCEGSTVLGKAQALIRLA